MKQLIFVLIDGLSATAMPYMSYLAAYAERGAERGAESGAESGVMDCALPTLSRPIYATLFTGLTPLDTRVVHNGDVYLSDDVRRRSFFTLMQQNKLACAAVAYHWMFELYTGKPFDPAHHRCHNDATSPLPYGLFYAHDAYPDDQAFHDALYLQERYKPPFLLLHTMGVDYAGHGHGLHSVAYRHAVRSIDMLLAQYVPLWLAQGCSVVVTADHGMHEDGAHNDLDDAVRRVPYWILQPPCAHMPRLCAPQGQAGWFDVLCAYFDLPRGQHM